MIRIFFIAAGIAVYAAGRGGVYDEVTLHHPCGRPLQMVTVAEVEFGDRIYTHKRYEYHDGLIEKRTMHFIPRRPFIKALGVALIGASLL